MYILVPEQRGHMFTGKTLVRKSLLQIAFIEAVNR